MSSARFSGLNILLLVVAAASLMFGAYGLMNGDNGESSRPRVGAGPLDGDLPATGGEDKSDATERGTERNTRDARRDQESRSTVGDRETTNSPDDVVYKDAEVGLQIDVESNPSDRGDAVIQGTVLSAAGAAIEGVVVKARRANLEMSPPRFQGDDIERYREEVSDFLAQTVRETRSTATDAQGNFRFTGLDPTLAYNLAASSDSHGTAEQNRVAAGDTIVLLMSARSLLRGRVENSAGEPVTSFEVRAWRQNRQWEASSRSFNSEDGRFTMPERPGIMQIEITAKGYSKTDPQDAEVGGEEVTIVLEQAAVLSGVVTDKEGNPLADATVRVGTDSGRNNWGGMNRQGATSARTDSKGRYQIDTLSPKETTLTASLGEMSDSQTVNLTPGENTLDFSMSVGGVLHIRLSDPDGNPMESDGIWFQMEGNRGWPRPERLPPKEPGLAEYAGLNPGEYTMTVTASGYPAIQEKITVQDGSNELKLQFSNGATLAGTVTSSSGSRMTGLRALLRKEEDIDRWGGWGTGRNVRVSDDGEFKIGPAEPGQWLFEMYQGNNWNDPVYSETITLIEGENRQAVVVDAGATVEISVVDEEGNAVSWANVRLQGEKNYNQRTNGEGVATLSFVQLGAYTMVANSRGKASSARYVTLRAGDNKLSVTVQEPNACRLTHVYPDTQASSIGLQVGDLVIEYNGEAVTSWGGLRRAIRGTRNSDDVVMLVERGGSMLTFTLKGGTVGIEGTDGVR